MTAESHMRSRVMEWLRPLHAVAIENAVDVGTPDVNFVNGWLELKQIEDWPARETSVVRIPHFKPEQRMWLAKRCAQGGLAWLLLRVGREWVLVWGQQAATHLGQTWTRSELTSPSAHVAYWPTAPNGQELIKALVLRRWTNKPGVPG